MLVLFYLVAPGLPRNGGVWDFHSALNTVMLSNISTSWIQKPGSFSCSQKENYKNNPADVSGSSHRDPAHFDGDWERSRRWAHAGGLASARSFLLLGSVFLVRGERFGSAFLPCLQASSLCFAALLCPVSPSSSHGLTLQMVYCCGPPNICSCVSQNTSHVV